MNQFLDDWIDQFTPEEQAKIRRFREEAAEQEEASEKEWRERVKPGSGVIPREPIKNTIKVIKPPREMPRDLWPINPDESKHRADYWNEKRMKDNQ